LRDSYTVKVKALSKRLFHLCHPTHLARRWGMSSAWNNCKDKNFFGNLQEVGEVFYEMAVWLYEIRHNHFWIRITKKSARYRQGLGKV